MLIQKGLILLVMAISCHCTISKGVSAANQDLASGREYLKDPVSDILRLNRSETINRAQLSDAVLDEGASANLGSILSNIVDNGLNTEVVEIVPQHESSETLENMNQVPLGRRRFDFDDLSLASTGQLKGNKFVIDNNENYLNKAASRDHKRRLQANFESQEGGRGVQNRRYYNGQSEAQQPNQLEASDNQSYNRRSMVMNRNSNKRNKVHNQMPKERLTGNQQRTIQSNHRSESRKRQSRPLVSKAKRTNDNRIRDDIMDDDGDDDSSDRRSDSSDADEEVDDDDSLNDEKTPNRRYKERNHVGGRKTKAASEQQDDEGERTGFRAKENENVDSGSDEEIDSSNNRLRKYKPEMRVDDKNLSASNVKNSATDLQVAAGHHHGHHDHYYQHVEVPKKKAWKFGFKRGNHKHTIERHEKGHKHKFHSSFKWHAKEKCKKKKKCKSVGKMTWEYKHAKKHHH